MERVLNMYRCSCLHKDGKYYEEYAYTIDEYKNVYNGHYDTLKGGYIDLFATFDIEASMVINEKRSIGADNDQYDGFMYIWQFCIEGNVIMGRTWGEYLSLLDYLTDKPQ